MIKQITNQLYKKKGFLVGLVGLGIINNSHCMLPFAVICNETVTSSDIILMLTFNVK